MSGERWPVLEDLSRHDNISRERVRQIEVRAFEKCRKTIRIAVLQQRRGWQNFA
jgi:RNA polymerase sigma-32 factor